MPIDVAQTIFPARSRPVARSLPDTQTARAPTSEWSGRGETARRCRGRRRSPKSLNRCWASSIVLLLRTARRIGRRLADLLSAFRLQRFKAHHAVRKVKNDPVVPQEVSAENAALEK